MTKVVQNALVNTCKAELSGTLHFQLAIADGEKVPSIVVDKLAILCILHLHPLPICFMEHFQKHTAKEELTFAHFPLFHKLSPYFQLLVFDKLHKVYTTLTQCKDEVLYFRYVSVSLSVFNDFFSANLL